MTLLICAGARSPRLAPGAAPDAANPTFTSLPVGYDPAAVTTKNYILNLVGQDLIPFTYDKKVACLDAVDDRIKDYPHSSVLVEIVVCPGCLDLSVAFMGACDLAVPQLIITCSLTS